MQVQSGITNWLLMLWVALWVLPTPALAQEKQLMPEESDGSVNTNFEHDFIWIRGKYTNHNRPNGSEFSYRFGNRNWWRGDFDEADRNLLRGVRRYTNLDTSSFSYKALSLKDPKLFEHPILYFQMKWLPLYSQNGPNFTQEEASILREYMLRGGFIIIDDLWGPSHWQDFMVELTKLFPKRKLERIDASHSIFHCFFDVNEIKQVPGRGVTWNYRAGFTFDNPNFPTEVHGIFDDKGRLMMIVNYNTDLGDGWEHTFDEFYPTRYCNEAYKQGINYIIYALTH